MSEPVADTADVMPRQAGAQTLRIFPKPYRRLADEEKLALDRGDGLPLYGMWKDRTDIGDRVEYVNRLRGNPRGQKGVNGWST